MDLADLYQGKRTPRQIGVFAHELPPGSATRRSVGDDTAWPIEVHLLASAVDALTSGNWQRGGGVGSRPRPVRRPSDALHADREVERHLERAAAFKARQRRQAAQKGRGRRV